MRVYLECKEKPKETYFLSKEGTQKGVDVAVFGFVDGEICYEKELHGETSFFEGITGLSKRLQSVALCGCITNIRGQKRKSVAVAEKGKLLGVSDMLNGFGGFAGGAEVRVYETGAGRMGVAVAEDLCFPDIIKTLALCGSDFIVCVCERVENIHEVLTRAHAYCYGVPILFCGEARAMIADEEGTLIFDCGQGALVEFFPKKEHYIIECRRRGVGAFVAKK
ncbi:MAG: hypothetical protein E7368_04165 [Clostridiales bacterium]|nr:hypothetical protein [Clostridiales bacterium]